MIRPVVVIVLLISLLTLHAYVLQRTAVSYARLPRGAEIANSLPTPLLKITALEFQGLVADFLFLDAAIFYGGKIHGKQRPDMKPWEWRWLERTLTAATELDPYFFDPYYFGNAVLSWEAGMVQEANILLEKGSNSRIWDWQLPFNLGFNKFYFLNDNVGGAESIKRATQRPGAPSIYSTLAARLFQQENKTGIAVAYLQGIIANEKDERLKKTLSMRLNALEKILALEKAVDAYKNKKGSSPRDLNVLVREGFISRIPRDPYGGEFYLQRDGSVQTTSKLTSMPSNTPPQRR